MTIRDVAVVIVAAGKGERLGAEVPKAFVELNQRPLFAHSLANAAALAEVAQIVVAAPADLAAAVRAEAAVLGLDELVVVVAGGATRQQSIAAALSAVAADLEIALIHDAARPLAPTALFEDVAESVRETGLGTVPVLAVADTIKRIDGDLVLETVDRETLRRAQTPQGFKLAELKAAYADASADFTDDAALMQAHGHSIRFVDGHADAFKITTADDLAAAKRHLAGELRTGIGVDVHRFTEDASKPLFLGTVEWAGERGLDGHSDGDAVSHALVDALLAAAALGDIGSNFGVDRPEFAGANGQVFITETVRLLAEAGFEVVNASVQVIGNRPKIAPHRVEVEKALSNLVGAPVTLGATTTDGLGFLGNSEGVAAVATALVRQSKGRLAS